MRKSLLSCLLVSFALTACADHSGSVTTASGGPDAPINDPDNGVFQPGTPGGGSGLPSSNPGGGGGSAGGGGSSGGGSSGGGSGGGGGSTGGEPGSGGTGGPGGGGQPVPEPSTLLLVGTGLAGAALLRRRRKPGSVD